MVLRLFEKIRGIMTVGKRQKINEGMITRLNNPNVSIISSNCIGGILYHDLGLRFNSPTINLYFDAEDFVKFCENLTYYLNIVPEFSENHIDGYPICLIDDVKVHAVHFQSFQHFLTEWEKRKKRVDLDNVRLIMTDRNNCTPDLINRFSKLNYNKVFFSSKPLQGQNFAVYVDVFAGEMQVGELQKIADFSGHRYYEKFFDIITFINRVNEHE